MSGPFAGIAFARPEIAALAYATPVLALFYLLRRPAVRADVPFLPFWEKVLATHRRKPSAARLLLSLLLQATIFVLLVLLAAGPYREERKPPSRTTIVVVDRTGPAAPVGAATLARAAAAAVDAVRAGGVAEIAAWSGGGVRGLGRAADEATAVALVRTAPPARGPRDVAVVERFLAAAPAEAALVAATPFAAPERGGFRRAAIRAVPGFDPAAPNGGVRAATWRDAAAECELDVGPGRTLRLSNAAGASVEAPASRRTSLAPPAGDGPWRVALLPPDAWPDDDAVELPAPRGGLLRVLVVAAEETPALDAALAASGLVDPARSSRAAPSAWRDVARNYDVTVLVGRDELSAPPPGRYFLIDGVVPGAGVVRTGGYGRTRVVSRAESTPWLRALDPEEWEIRRAGEFVAASDVEVLATGDRGPLFVRAAGEGSRFLALLVPATPAASTLPLLPAFPVLVRGALAELSPTAEEGEAGATTRLRPADAPGPDDRPAVDRDALDPPAAPAPEEPVRRSAVPFFAALLGAFLALEWLLYHAGTTD